MAQPARHPFPPAIRSCALLAIAAGLTAPHFAAAQQQAATTPAAAAPAPRSAEGAEAVLLELSLDARPGRVLSLDERSVVFIDDRSRRREVSTGELLAIIPSAAPITVPATPTPSRAAAAPSSIVISTMDADAQRAQQPAPESGLLHLTDNQRYTGDLAPPASGDSEDLLAWRHADFGQLAFPFEQVSRFTRPAAPPAALPSESQPPSQDLLLLANGDLLRGFLAGLSGPARFETDAGPIDIELPLVVGAALANPPAPAEGLRVWLADGSVVRAIALELDPRRRLNITLSDGQHAAFDWESVRAVLFDAARLVPLAAAPIRSQEPVGDRRFAAPVERALPGDSAARWPAFDAWNLIAPGPMAIEFDLPAGAARLATRIELTDSRSPWGDCDVIFHIDGREVLRRHLSAADPASPVNLDLSGATTLRLVIEPGAYGPIRDSVTLHQPLILVATSP